MLLVIFFIGVMIAFFGLAGFAYSLLQILGFSAYTLWFSPAAGVFFSIGMTSTGLLMMIGDYYLARFCYHVGIRYLKWNISVIMGTECAA